MKQKSKPKHQNRQNDTLSPLELIKFAKESSFIKIVNSTHQLNNDQVQVVDISIKFTGTKEETLYADQKIVYDNIRRGLSLFILFNQETMKETHYIGRKGLKKFFDIYYEHINKEIDHTWISRNHLIRQLRAYTFGEIEKILRDNKEIQIYQLDKLNGENIQISYFKEMSSWVISQKKSCLLLQNQENVTQDNRYKFAYQAAQIWFKYLAEQSNETVEQLKEFLSEHTLIGEYIGDQNYQHLVKYDQISLRFFAIVEKETNNTCICPSIAMEQFKKFNLQHVNFIKYDVKGMNEFVDKMNLIYKEISLADIETLGEGTVLYFSHEKQFLSLGKIKTLEYRLLRKIREKIKFQLQEQVDAEKMFKKFESECEELCQFYKPNKFDFTLNLGQKAFKYIEAYMTQNPQKTYSKELNQINNHFIYFIKLIQNNYQDDIFAKLTKDCTDIDLEVDSEVSQKLQKKKVNRVFLILPLTIPATGKSVFTQELKKNINQLLNDDQCQFYEIESDKIRKQILDEYLSKNKNCSRNDAMKKTQKSYAASYREALEELLRNIKKLKPANSIIFMDKNHPVNALQDPMKTAKSYLSDFDLKIVGLMPKIQTPYRYYPFSLTYLISCIQRALKRKDHATLIGDDRNVATVIISFFSFFRNVSKNSVPLECVIEIPFTNESDENEKLIKEQLGETIYMVLKQKGFEGIQEMEQELDQIIDFCQKKEYGFPDKEVQQKAIRDQLLQMMN